jgi:NAD(P)-dependent dehydrogenase (short-subunit alcohol dehydrogenase family)
MTSKNALIIGAGSKFGKDLVNSLKKQGYIVYGITSSKNQTDQYLEVNWETCFINDFERYLKNLPSIDLVVFNQNSPALTDACYSYGSVPTLELWKRVKMWSQSHFVNCIMPLYLLQTLANNNKLNINSTIGWMVSQSMFLSTPPMDYVGQKYQNHAMMKELSIQNSQTHISIDPGEILKENSKIKADALAFFLKYIAKESTGNLYKINMIGQITLA